MSDFKLYGKCVGCRRKRFFVRKRTLDIPNGGQARSKDLVCTPCFKTTKKALRLK